jgi:hypothetical protein
MVKIANDFRTKELLSDIATPPSDIVKMNHYLLNTEPPEQLTPEGCARLLID